MGAQLLLLPLLFISICISFLMLQNFYQRWKMKEVMKKKREAAKISLVNIMQLTNSTLISPTWPREPLSVTEPANKNDLPTYNQLIASEGACGGDVFCMGHIDAHNSHILSSVVTLTDEQESPPPYDDLYDSKGKPQFQSVFFSRYQNPCRALVLESCPSSESECNSPKKISEGCGGGCSENCGRDSSTYPQNKTCLLQIPQQPTQLEPDPSLERRNSSAVLYL